MTTEEKKPRAANRLEALTLPIAMKLLSQMYGEEQATRVAGEVSLAFQAARAAAKDPSAFDQCSPQSIANCIACSAATGLRPGGPSPAVYIVPKRVKGQWALNWWMTHNGIARLAGRAGYTLAPSLIHKKDDFMESFGEAVHHVAEHPVRTMDDVRACVVSVKRNDNGQVIGRYVVGVDIITSRRDAESFGRKMSGPVWKSWPLEMAKKTAIKYIFARGITPIATPEWQAAMTFEVMQATKPEPVAISRPAQLSPARALLDAPHFMDEEPAAPTREPATVKAESTKPAQQDGAE